MSGCTLLSMAANLVAVLVLTLAQTNLLKILQLPAVMAAALVLLAGADGLLGHWLKPEEPDALQNFPENHKTKQRPALPKRGNRPLLFVREGLTGCR